MPIGGVPVIADLRQIRWDEYEGYTFENPTGAFLHSALPHPISLVDSYVSFDLTIPSYEELVYAMHNYDATIYNSKELVCLTGFNTPIIEFVFYYVNQNDTMMRILVAGNSSGSSIDLNIGYDETHHFEIILKDYTAEIIMDDETLEFSNNSYDEPISIVPVSNEQPYLFIGTWYFSYFVFTLRGIHIETDTVLASADYDIDYWLGEFERRSNNV